jgi:poly-beta-1,6-N-acetyl-D-glucosamine synthase
MTTVQMRHQQLPEARPPTDDEMQIVAVIAARNEGACIAASVRALWGQTLPPDRVLVVVNNTTDDTAAQAGMAGAEVLVMESNPHAKAGALNFGIERVMPGLRDSDYIFVQDADTECVPGFFARAVQASRGHGNCVVSGRYACRPEHGLIGMMQRNEFAREGQRLNRRRNLTHIVVGTSCLLPVGALRAVHVARAKGLLPGRGYVYTTYSRTEDYEMTLALKTLGYLTMSPMECEAITDVMDTVPKLWSQRIRWWRGGFEDIATYGWTPVTRGFIARQLMMLFSMGSFILYLVALAWTLAAGQSVAFSLAFLPVTALFVLDRVVEVRKAGPLAMLVSGLLLPELVYDIFLHATYVVSASTGIRTGIALRHGAVEFKTSDWKDT